MIYLRNNIGLEILGKRIKEIRLSKGISQFKLASDCNVEVSQISRLERGKLNVGVSLIFEIAKVLDIELSEIFNFKII